MAIFRSRRALRSSGYYSLLAQVLFCRCLQSTMSLLCFGASLAIDDMLYCTSLVLEEQGECAEKGEHYKIMCLIPDDTSQVYIRKHV